MKEFKLDYADRKVTRVDVWNVQVHKLNNGETNVSGQILIRMSSAKGDDNGPQVQIGLATLSEDDDPTIRGAELSLLKTASAFLKRVSEEDVTNLQSALSRERDEANEQGSAFSPGD